MTTKRKEFFRKHLEKDPYLKHLEKEDALTEKEYAIEGYFFLQNEDGTFVLTTWKEYNEK